MGAPRIASTIDTSLPVANQRAVSTETALERPVVFTGAQMKDHEFSAKQFTALSLQVAQVTKAHRSHPEQAPMTFKNVLCDVGGAKVLLHHGFGRYADFTVVNWKSLPLPSGPTTQAPRLVCDVEEAVATRRTDSHFLCLNSYVAGVASIRVYPGA